MKVLLTHGTAIMLIMLIVGTYMAGNIDDGEYVLPLVMYLLHKIVVALKYASLFPEEYSKLKSARDNVTVQSYQQQVQMIASWLGSTSLSPHLFVLRPCCRIYVCFNFIYLSRAKFGRHGVRNQMRCRNIWLRH